ncbi:hypothetical protein [Nibribacter koreensis]|uniref:Uncharacterized protein n=1 Tax=Nibribacter koreensis TaxID=1084519 RepID=A0ABP8FFR1_9BACT
MYTLKLFITFILVTVVKAALGFDYHVFKEGIITGKFLVDLLIWGFIYYLVHFLFQKIYNLRPATYSETEQ